MATRLTLLKKNVELHLKPLLNVLGKNSSLRPQPFPLKKISTFLWFVDVKPPHSQPLFTVIGNSGSTLGARNYASATSSSRGRAYSKEEEEDDDVDVDEDYDDDDDDDDDGQDFKDWDNEDDGDGVEDFEDDDEPKKNRGGGRRRNW